MRERQNAVTGAHSKARQANAYVIRERRAKVSDPARATHLHEMPSAMTSFPATPCVVGLI
jgi:hypothetical protein